MNAEYMPYIVFLAAPSADVQRIMWEEGRRRGVAGKKGVRIHSCIRSRGAKVLQVSKMYYINVLTIFKLNDNTHVRVVVYCRRKHLIYVHVFLLPGIKPFAFIYNEYNFFLQQGTVEMRSVSILSVCNKYRVSPNKIIRHNV